MALACLVLAGCGDTTATAPSLVEASAPKPRYPGSGATLGLVLATEAGRGMDERDRQLSAEAEYEALQYGQAGTAREWTNPKSGRSGAVTPGPAYSVNEYTCRDYSHRVVAGSKQDMVRSTACRQADGSWRPLG